MIKFKTIKDLIVVAKVLGISYYNQHDYYIVLRGINGNDTVVYIENNQYKKKPSTMKDFANHLKQMGRDSLKIDLYNLLN